MKKYLCYTNARLPWSQPIPVHWKLLRNKVFLQEREEKSTEGKETLLSLSQYTGISVKGKDTDKTGMYRAESLIGYKVVHTNDIVMNIMLAWNGSTARSKQEGIISPAYAVYNVFSDAVNPDYLHYIFKTHQYMKYFETFSTGIIKSRLRLYPQTFLHLYTIIPPREEQDQIVRFLDWKVSSINKLINVKKKQLEEFKALVNKQFVLLSSQAKKQVRLKYLVELDSDFVQIQDDHYYIKTGMYNRGRGIFRKEAILGKNMGDSSFQKIHAGRVMISGQFAWEAATYVTVAEDEIGVASHRYYLLNPTDGVPAEYIWCYLMAEYGQLQMKLCSHGAAGRNRPLNIKELMNVYIPIPNIGTELRALVQNVQKMMKLRINLNSQDKILDELKARVISDVVTGKIDVRDIEIPDYEYIEEADETVKDNADDTEG